MNKQISLFDRVQPLAVYFHNIDKKATIQSQAKIYCRVCRNWLQCGGMLSWRVTAAETEELAKSEFVCRAFAIDKITEDGRCKRCGTIVSGVGCENGGIAETR